MKFILSFSLLCFSTLFLDAQSAWTWLKGNAFTPGFGVYGIRGVADPANLPASRSGAFTWQDKEGNSWLFGGYGRSATGAGYLNDLWKYSASTGIWTWMNGNKVHNPPATYGTKGVASAVNQLRPRTNMAHWIDTSGNIWIYGGDSYNNFLPNFGGYTFLNDLWKYSSASNTWTWISGDTLSPTATVYNPRYGTKGVASASNNPGSRQGSTTWVDGSGDFWLYGGYGAPRTSLVGYLSDLWKYNTGTGLWTWVAGDTVSNLAGRYGQKGSPNALNKPGGKLNATGWTDTQGNLWLFGGNGYVFLTSFGGVNDLWKYTPGTGQWTWVSGDTLPRTYGIYGDRGVPSVNNKPGARAGAIEWSDPQGNFWLFAGSGVGGYNDLWKYSPGTSEWTWMTGDTGAVTRKAVYGLPNTASDSARPAAGSYTGGWTDRDGNFWLTGTTIRWRYSPAANQWAWVGGDTTSYGTNLYQSIDPAVFGTKGIESAGNNPPARKWGASWRDAAGNLWMYGGLGYDTSTTSNSFPYLRSDLWKYNPGTQQWTWVNGDATFNNRGNHGALGIPSENTTPGGLYGATSWTDKEGNLWLFGGSDNPNPLYFDANDVYGELWKYNPLTNQWSWVSGGGTSPYSIYTQRSGDTTLPHPGFRYNATGWTDSSGNFWLFGGQGFAAYGLIYMGYGSYGKLNDLWKFTPATNRWTFISGGRTTSSSGDGSSLPGYYGTKGVPGTSSPGGRSSSVSWIDGAGNLWMFGGTSDFTEPGPGGLVVRQLNDLWRYTPSTGLWTWMGGDSRPSQPGIYRTKGISDTISRPGARMFGVTWTDSTDNLYLFGGKNDTTGPLYSRYYNDLWKFSPATQAWTWLGGDAIYNMPGYYGTRGMPSSLVQPGARDGSMSWSDGSGNAWIFSGYGYPVTGQRYLNDLLQYSANAALPVKFSRFTAQKQGEFVQLNWTTAQEQNSQSFVVERSPNGASFQAIGRVAAAGNTSYATNYAFTDFIPINGNNFYRIKEVDRDGKSMYSAMQKVSFGDVSSGFSILTNPVKQELTVSLLLPVEQVLQIQVRDAAGHLLISRQISATKGSSQLHLPVDHLAAGTYFLQIGSASLHGTKTFVKQ